MDDIALQIQRVLDGDIEAFAYIVRLYQDRLFHFLSRLGLSQSQCEDTAQEAFVRAMRHLHRFDPSRATFTTWLFTIARNLALTHLKREARAPQQSAAPLESLADSGSAPDTLVEFSQLKAQVQQCLASLSAADRTVLALAYDDAFSNREAATIAQCSEAAYRTRLHRARSKLRHCLEQSDAIK